MPTQAPADTRTPWAAANPLRPTKSFLCGAVPFGPHAFLLGTHMRSVSGRPVCPLARLWRRIAWPTRASGLFCTQLLGDRASAAHLPALVAFPDRKRRPPTPGPAERAAPPLRIPAGRGTQPVGGTGGGDGEEAPRRLIPCGAHQHAGRRSRATGDSCYRWRARCACAGDTHGEPATGTRDRPQQSCLLTGRVLQCSCSLGVPRPDDGRHAMDPRFHGNIRHGS